MSVRIFSIEVHLTFGYETFPGEPLVWCQRDGKAIWLRIWRMMVVAAKD